MYVLVCAENRRDFGGPIEFAQVSFNPTHSREGKS
jgi:hypothetical protein